MNVNVTYKKMVIFIVLLAVIVAGAKWFKDTAPKRQAKREVRAMIEYAQRQALEIAIIEQASKLTDYKQQLGAARKQKAATPVPFTPPMTAPFMPAVPKDPNDS